MDKPSMTLGWLVGRQIAGQRRTQKKEPIAYLYNGVQLPPLPEWDTETYPYAWISYSVLGHPYFDVWQSKPVKSGSWMVSPTGVERIPGMNSMLSYDGLSWGALHESGLSAVGNTTIPFWSNFDILNEDGSVYLAASDPIPVYE